MPRKTDTIKITNDSKRLSCFQCDTTTLLNFNSFVLLPKYQNNWKISWLSFFNEQKCCKKLNSSLTILYAKNHCWHLQVDSCLLVHWKPTWRSNNEFERKFLPNFSFKFVKIISHSSKTLLTKLFPFNHKNILR